LSNSIIESSDQAKEEEEKEEEEEERDSMMGQKIDGSEGEDIQIWGEEEVRRLMEIDAMDMYEMTSYDAVMYESSHILDHLF